MSFSEDSSSPATPFSGDKTGQIFDLPDMVAGSPTTNERVLDTQSGFIVVVKRLNEAVSLFIKRRIGTPPSSSVALTPDESLKLSKILATSFSAEDLAEEASFRTSRRRRQASKLFGAESQESETSAGRDQSDTTENAEAIGPADLVISGQSASSVHLPMKLMLGSVLRAFLIPILGIALTVFAFGLGAGFTGAKLVEKPQAAGALPMAADSLSQDKVDLFVREFVSQMLDFTEKSYRSSQVRAMSRMSDELLEKYWLQTRFPLSKKQLKLGSSVLIEEIKQERNAANTAVADITAKLTLGQTVTPVKLRLTLGLNAKREIVVLDQEDLSASQQR